MSELRDLSAGYRRSAALLRVAIEDVKADLEALDPALPAVKKDMERRLKSLNRSLRECRSLMEICERYYEPGYHPSPVFTCSELKARKVDETK